MRVFGNQKWPTLKFGRFENSDIVGTPSYLKHADNSKENLSFLLNVVNLWADHASGILKESEIILELFVWILRSLQ